MAFDVACNVWGYRVRRLAYIPEGTGSPMQPEASLRDII